MADKPPVIYILHGDDEYAIAVFLAEMEARLGDPSFAAMNISRLEGRTFNLDDLPNIANAMPFLTTRRLVILDHATARLTTIQAQEKFQILLSRIPVSTAMVLVEDHVLTEEKDRRKNKINWLEAWALQHSERVFLKAFPAPKGDALASRIQKEAKAAGGRFSFDAARRLADLAGDDPRLAAQEMHKLLDYVDYRRKVEIEDVDLLTADSNQGDIFAMVDALGNRDPHRAMDMLRRQLEQQEPISVLGMITRQFRMLILCREALDTGQVAQIPQILHLPPFVSEKIAGQARRFDLPFLEAAYHKLLELDESIKTSLVEDRVGIETFVAAFTISS